MKNINQLPLKKQKEIAERLKTLRITAGYTQEEIAKKINVTTKTYREWEKGKCAKDNTFYYPAIECDNLLFLSEIYDVSIDYLLCHSDCTSVDNHYISKKTGLSEKAIEELQYLALLDSTLATEPDLNTINTLLKQLNSKYNNIIHAITEYLRSNGLHKDFWYDIRNETLSEKKPPMDTDRVHIPAHSDIFDNLLLMDIQKRIINLKNEIKKAPNTN